MVDGVGAHLHERTAHADAGNHLAGNGARRHAHGGFAGTRPPPAAIVSDPVFRPVGEIGVAGTKLVLDVGVVLAALIDVVDQQADRRAGRDLTAVFVLEDPRQDAHAVRLPTLGRETGLPGFASI